MMDHINDDLGRLSELDEAGLNELTSKIVEQFESLESEELSSEIVEQMTELASALETVKAELDARTAQAAELAEMKEAAIQRVRGGEAATDEENPEEDAAPDEESPEDAVDEENKDKEVYSTDEGAEAELSTETDSETELSTNTEVEAVEEVAPATEAAVETEELSVSEEATEELSTEEETVAEAAEELSTEEEVPAAEETAELSTENEVETELSATEEASSEEAVVEETELSTREDSEAEMSVSENDQSPDVQAPDTHRPVAEVRENARAAVTITAGGDIPGVSNGSVMENMDSVAHAMAQRLHAVRRSTGGDGEQFTVATFNIEYPEDRSLISGDSDSNNEKIRAVTSPQAITAAGGFCAPVEVSYDVFGFGVTDRPVKSALASFSADRGGIRYTESPVLGDLAAAVSLWTLQDDIDAATAGAPDPTKPCLRVSCGAEVVVNTDAIPLCLTFGNLQTRAFPEQVARNNELALIEHARYAETRLLTRIGSLSTSVSAAEKLGAARDFFRLVDQAAAAYRSRHRLSPSESLRVIAPAWLLNMARADLVMAMPGAADDPFAIADNTIASWFRVRHINVTWALDGETGQIFGAQSAGALLDFPSSTTFYMFSEGTFLFLDGGTLDLGIVRDSSLNATNDYKMFVETFEAVAKVGIESLRITANLDVTGAVAGTVDPSGL